MKSAVASAGAAPRGPLPLVVGVTGHRDLRAEDVGALEAQVRTILAGLAARSPHTPLVLLSPLAEGADRLVARVALDLGVRLVVPLPLPRALYEDDFGTDASRSEFAALLARAQTCFELPLVAGDHEADVRAHGAARERQYAHVGAYIVRHCQILLALWDGSPVEQTGGTSQIVRFNLEGVPEPYAPPRSLLDPVESGPVYHILTPRRSNPSPEGRPFSVRHLFPEGYDSADEARVAYDRIFDRMDAFNSDALRVAPDLSGELAQSAGYLLPEEKAGGLAPALRTARERYALADTLAIHFQRRTLHTLAGLFGLGFLAVVFYQVYTQVFPDSHALLILYVAALGLASAWHWWAQGHDFQNKHLDYRALAEGQRVQFFWRLADLPDAVADHYLRRQKGDLDWIRNALRVWTLPVGSPGGEPAGNGDACAPMMPLVRAHWVEDQYKYFARAALRSQHKLERYQWGISPLFWLGLLVPLAARVAGSLLGVSNLGRLMGLTEEFDPFNLVDTVMGSLLFLAALLAAYAEKRALSEHAKQYARMSLLFGNARHGLEERLGAGDGPGACALIGELGREALVENGDWVILHRERPLEVPKA